MELAARIEGLSAHLHATKPLWTERPFDGDVGWTDDHPALVDWLFARRDGELARLERSRIPRIPHTPWSADTRALTRLPALPRRPVALPEPWGDSVPARKWTQIQAYIAAMPALPAEVVDWCAGKSHLGRTLARVRGIRVVAVERQARLCADGASLAEEAGVDAAFVCADALGPDAARLVGPDRGAIALHACGHLTDALLDAADRHGARFLAVAPCCCHHQPPSGWVPRAEVTRRFAPELPRNALRLATAEDCEAGDRWRIRAMAYRLGLDQLLRVGTGVDAPHLVPRLPGPVLAGSFEGFARAGADAAGLPLPGRWDPVVAEEVGWRRAREVRALDLIRGQLRRALELVVWLDRARWLEERGWRVTVGTFCARAVTPRNLLILATR